MKYLIVKFDDVMFEQNDTAGVVVIHDDTKADEVLHRIETDFRYAFEGDDSGEQAWDTLEDYLADMFGDTVTYEGFEGTVWI